MEILIAVVVVACVLLALIPRYIATRGRTEAPPSHDPRPSPLAPTGPAATATAEVYSTQTGVPSLRRNTSPSTWCTAPSRKAA